MFGRNDLEIDFSFSIQDWLDVFKELFEIFEKFFSDLFGGKLFADPAEESTSANN